MRGKGPKSRTPGHVAEYMLRTTNGVGMLVGAAVGVGTWCRVICCIYESAIFLAAPRGFAPPTHGLGILCCLFEFVHRWSSRPISPRDSALIRSSLHASVRVCCRQNGRQP